MTRVHSKVNFQEFPSTCDLCEEILSNENELKLHKKNCHTFHSVRYRCNACDFLSQEIETMNVHYSREHGNNQCGLCDKNFKTRKDLDEHLSKCEIFLCSKCKTYFQDLEKMKEHIIEKYGKYEPSSYSWHYIRIHAQDKCENEVFRDLVTIAQDEW